MQYLKREPKEAENLVSKNYNVITLLVAKLKKVS